jgi:hypothetical protein
MKTLTKLTLLTSLLLITSCEKKDRTMHDMCLQREIFKECMESLPAGPTSTKYNDWDEVVIECRKVAYHYSKRRESAIKNECKGNGW